MTPAFDVTDSATWPAILNAAEVAAIYRRKVGGLKKACQEHRFVPAPFQVRPYRFRKVDVVRHVEGNNGPVLAAKRA